MSNSVRPIVGSPSGSPVPGILQARTLEWVAISFSNAAKWKVKVKSLSHFRPSATPWTAAFQAAPSIGFSRQEYWSGVPLPSPKIPSIDITILNRIKWKEKRSHWSQTVSNPSRTNSLRFPDLSVIICVLSLCHLSPRLWPWMYFSFFLKDSTLVSFKENVGIW